MEDYRRSHHIIVQCGLNILTYAGMDMRCALGKGGYGYDKCEGDGKTPLGCFPLRGLMIRTDRITLPAATFATPTPIAPHMGWCDDPASPHYNHPVMLPCDASHEELWRADGRYDIIIPLGYNDAPVVAGRGSAIFFHCASDDYQPTEGCVALSHADMLRLLAHIPAGCAMQIEE